MQIPKAKKRTFWQTWKNYREIIHFVLSTHNSQGISYHKYLHSVLIRTFAFASYQSASQALADRESCLHAIHTFLMSHVAGWYHILARTLSPKRGGHFLLELAHLGTVFEFFSLWCDSTEIHFLKPTKRIISSPPQPKQPHISGTYACNDYHSVIKYFSFIRVLFYLPLHPSEQRLWGREEEGGEKSSSAWTAVDDRQETLHHHLILGRHVQQFPGGKN